MPSLPKPTLLLLTDRTLLPPGMPLAQAVAPAVTGGVNLVILREHDLPAVPRLTLARFVQDGVRGRAPFLMTGPPDLVEKAGADGLHLEEESASVAEVRVAIGPERLLGVTLHAPTLRAEDVEGADYLLLLLDWKNPEASLAVLRECAGQYALPIIAGIDPPARHAPACLEAGATGVAICEPAMCAYNRTAAVQAYANALGLP